jgi:hypothetical protein
MQLEQKQIQGLLGGSSYYGVPDFQRDYVWRSFTQRAEVDQLLEDLHSAHQAGGHDHYFLGSMVVFDDADEERRMLVDGQQRTITLLLLLSSMWHKLNELRAEEISLHPGRQLPEASENLQILLKQSVRWVRNDIGSSALRFRFPDDASNEVLEDIIAHGGDHLSPGNGGNRYFLVKAARRCEQFLADSFPASVDLEGFAQFVLSEIDLVLITTTDLSSAYRIFWTLNDRGRALTASDLLKNFLFAQHRGTRRDARQLSDRWRAITNSLQAAGEPTPDRFLRYFVIANTMLDRVVSARMLFSTIQQHGDELGWNQPLTFASRLGESSRFYVQLRNGLDSAGSPVEPLANMRMMAPSVTQPLAALLAVPPDLRRGSSFEKLCAALETMTLVYGVTRERWNQFESSLPEITRQLRSAEGTSDLLACISELVDTQIVPRARAFWSALLDLRNVPDKTQRFLLASLALWIQEHARASEYRTLESLMQLTIEHVLPQSSLLEHDQAGRAWRQSFGADDVTEASTYVYMLGNLTLLPAEINAMIGARPYEEKSEAFARQPLLLTRSIAGDIREGNATGRRQLADTYDLEPHDEWNPTQLSRRNDWLMTLVKERWPLIPAAK